MNNFSIGIGTGLIGASIGGITHHWFYGFMIAIGLNLIIPLQEKGK